MNPFFTARKIQLIVYQALLLLFWVGWGTSAVGQATLRGRVMDAQTRRPVAGATCQLLNTDSLMGTQTNSRGEFSLATPDSVATVLVRYVGYVSKQVVVSSATDNLLVYLEPATQELNEVVVVGYENNRKLLQTPGSIGLLTLPDLQRFSNTSLVPAVNTIPGVRMEERSPGSYRLSIRGSSLRSPFGVRNVKVYWNDIPFTDPGGNTYLNLLDVNAIGRMEILKGPAGSVYGAGTGGTVLLQSPNVPVGETSFQLSSLAGSYGLRGINAAFLSGSERANTVFTYAHQQSDGYRTHTNFRRDVATWRSRFFVSNQQTISVSGFYADLFYQTPGGLTQAQFDENPRQARPATRVLPGSVEQRAAIYQKTFNLGVSQQYQWNAHLDNATSVYGTFTDFANPFITNYEKKAEQSFGGRTRFTYEANIGSLKNRFTLGGELQRGFTMDKNYGNRGGQTDTLQSDDEITALQYIVFGQIETEFPADWLLTLGGSYNRLTYDFVRLSDVPPDAQTRRFTPVFSPRIALLKTFREQWAAHASISYGFSPPTVAEFRPSEGTFNTGLEPEIGVNYEAGIRGSAWNQRLTFDLTAYAFQLRQTIVRRTATSGAEYFANAGRTDQQGIELATAWTLVDRPANTLSRLKLWANYTYNYYRFADYQLIDFQENDTADFSGNRLTGVAPNVAVTGVDAETRVGFYANVTFTFTDFIPLDDANTVYANDYTLLGGRIGFRRLFANGLQVDVFGGVDNALNERYSLGNDINAFGGRYFNPAAPVNFYGGLAVKYVWNK